MKKFAWNIEKNNQLIEERGISFERVIRQIEQNKILDVIKHPNTLKYPNQKIFILDIGSYAYLVPFVETEAEIFLKTIIPSRKASKKYLGVSHGQ